MKTIIMATPMNSLNRDGEEEKDYTKTHGKLDHDDHKVWCTRCKKVVEERDELPDYLVFMGAVWQKQNLPCSPSEKIARDDLSRLEQNTEEIKK